MNELSILLDEMQERYESADTEFKRFLYKEIIKLLEKFIP